MNICDEFHCNPFTKCRDILSHEISVNIQTVDDGQLDGQPRNTVPLSPIVDEGIKIAVRVVMSIYVCIITMPLTFMLLPVL